MGCHECVNCGEMLEMLDDESFECEHCGIGQDGSWICFNCATAGCCDHCGEAMCVSCGNEPFPCCDQVFCGSHDPSEENCAGTHIVTTLKCGHQGCNFQKDDEGCRTCITDEANAEKEAIAEDISTIKSTLGRIKSRSMKSALESIIQDHEGNKRKRSPLDEKEERRKIVFQNEILQEEPEYDDEADY